LLDLEDIKWAASSYTLKKQIIWAGSTLWLYDLSNIISTPTELDIDLPTEFVRPLITDTFTGCVLSIGSKGYSINTSGVVTNITGANWAEPSSLGFVDGYTLLSVKGSRFFNYSELNSTTFNNALLTAGMSGDVDPIGALCVINREVWLFGTKHAEVWYNSAYDVNTIFTRQDGRVFAQGLLSSNTVTVNGVGYNACLGDSAFGVFAWNSGGPQKISTGAIDMALESSKSSRMLFSFERNRLFIHVLIDDNTLWSYDVKGQSWNLREYYLPLLDIIKVDSYYCAVFSNGIHKLDGSDDLGEPITSYKQTSHIHQNGFRVFHKLVEFDVGGSVAEFMLRHSDDGGKTWKNNSYGTPAVIGEYNRYRFHRLGQSRDRIYKVVWRSSTTAGIYSGSIDWEIGTK
jgi:hypothetical protein